MEEAWTRDLFKRETEHQYRYFRPPPTMSADDVASVSVKAHVGLASSRRLTGVHVLACLTRLRAPLTHLGFATSSFEKACITSVHMLTCSTRFRVPLTWV